MSLSPELHYLPDGYEQRIPPDYFEDSDESGVTWQPDVYPEALTLARAHGRDVIIDLGAGRGSKLASLCTDAPEVEMVGVDFGPNIEWCRQNHDFGTWIDADLETCADVAIPTDLIERSVIVCSDVLEHLVNPRSTMDLIVDLFALGAACAVLSTPARDRRVGADYLGMPRNRAHVREWTQEEFQAFVRSFPVDLVRADLTRSDDGGGGLTTQLLVIELSTDRKAGDRPIAPGHGVVYQRDAIAEVLR